MLVAAPAAGADDTNQLFDTIEVLSREAAVNSDEVIALEEKIETTRDAVEAAEKKVNDSQDELDAETEDANDARTKAVEAADDATEASRLAREAKDAQDEWQEEVDDVAGARCRGTLIDPLTNAVNSRDPQAMIDRASYMGVLTGDAGDKLKELEEEFRKAVKRATGANADAASAKWIQDQLDDAVKERVEALDKLQDERNDLATYQKDLQDQKAPLTTNQTTLNNQIATIQAQIDGLSPELREEWVNRDNPIEVDLSAVGADGVVGSAMSTLGAPYCWGAAGPDQFDSSGLMDWSYQQQGKTIPRTSQGQIGGGTPVALEDLQPGDIVGFYPGVIHVGMYIGDGQIVHASDYGIPVQVVALYSMPFVGASRY